MTYGTASRKVLRSWRAKSRGAGSAGSDYSGCSCRLLIAVGRVFDCDRSVLRRGVVGEIDSVLLRLVARRCTGLRVAVLVVVLGRRRFHYKVCMLMPCYSVCECKEKRVLRFVANLLSMLVAKQLCKFHARCGHCYTTQGEVRQW